MRVIVTGGTGFIGTKVTAALLDRGDEVTLLVRPETDLSRVDGRAQTTSEMGAAASADAVVNLAGAGVLDKRWSDARLRVIHDSRVSTTTALARAASSVRVFVSASAVGYYGMRTDDAVLDESSPPGDDPLARICVDWEEATHHVRAGCRVAIARIGIVLGSDGGALARLVPMYRRFMGGPIGSGKQWWSWVHVRDVVSALLFAIDTPSLEGAFNATAETPATMDEVSRTLAKVLGRPNALRVPAFVLRAALGEAASVLLTGQRALPKKLLASGFRFQFSNLEDAIRASVE
jgi:hypothetical protein